MECIHCSNYDGCPLQGNMNLSDSERIIDEIATLGGVVLDISGGEPLMHPNLLEIISYAKARGLKTRIYTSGIICHSRASSISPHMAEKLNISGLDGVVFNLQGASSKTHEYITGTDKSFEKTVESIKNIKSRGLWVGVHFVPMKPNYNKLGKLVELCHHLKVDEVGILRFVAQGRGRENRKELELAPDEIHKLTLKATELKYKPQKKPKIRVGRPLDFCPLIDPSITFQTCNTGVSRCLIRPNGDVVPCPAFKQNRSYVAGSVKTKSLTEIWNNSPIWSQFRHFEYEKLRGRCKTCPYLTKCQGRCTAQRILAHGNMYEGPDPACFVLKYCQILPSPKRISKAFID